MNNPDKEIPVIKVGDQLPELLLPAINRTTLALYAGASGDHNPVHIDLDAARKAGMSDVFAHGMLSMAYLGRMLTDSFEQTQIRLFNARFVGITHLGNSLLCSAKVMEILERNGEKLARINLKACNQFGELKISGDALVAI